VVNHQRIITQATDEQLVILGVALLRKIVQDEPVDELARHVYETKFLKRFGMKFDVVGLTKVMADQLDIIGYKAGRRIIDGLARGLVVKETRHG